jgi:hypothetical protein
MDPLIEIAADLVPSMYAFTGAKSVEDTIKKAVTEVTKATDPTVIRSALAADPAMTSQLKLRLGQIVAEADQARRQAELGEHLKLLAAIPSSSPMAWGAPIVSIVVTIGFFGVLAILIWKPGNFPTDGNHPIVQLVIVSVGALTASFTTAVSFWLGSSVGSRNKDTALIESQVAANQAPPPPIK